MPSKKCCGVEMEPIVVIDGDANLYLECPICIETDSIEEWPFDEEYAATHLFREAGFRIE